MKNIILFLVIIPLLFSCQSDIETVQEKPVAISKNSETKNVSQEETKYLVPPVRPITHGPKYHWFGYYDKLQFDPACRYVLGMEVDFEDRSPEPDDIIKIGMVDLEDNDRWIELGETRAWNWQQGCMLQWLPGSDTEIIWNDREGDHFVCHILDIKTREKRTILFPIYAVSPDGRTAVSLDFPRVNHMRPGYGYAGIPDQTKDEMTPENAGVYRVDLKTGKSELIISIADVAKIPYPHWDISDKKHYFNHLLFNQDGSRFIFLDRWRTTVDPDYNRLTRMFTASPDGEDIRIINDDGNTSHFIWRDPLHILAWAIRYPSYGDRLMLFKDDGSREASVVGDGVITEDGHCSYLPGNEWIIYDSYPDENRLQQVFLFHAASGKKVTIGYFYLAPRYKGEWRVDTHPRHSPDGRYIVIDSAHGGCGRQMYLIDIKEIVNGK